MTEEQSAAQSQKQNLKPEDPHIVAVKEFAERLGGIEQAKAALETLSELRKSA